ncbi:hypothetical protein IV102_11780 [bacterium]|nr:hypothetical protein [bacterium]
MKRTGPRGAALLLEIVVGLLIILFVVLVVGSIFPTSYQGSLQAARMSAAVNLARQVLERQKLASPAIAIGNQTVDSEFLVQGRPAVCRFVYRLDADSAANSDPRLWKVTVQWEHTGKIKEVFLVGAMPGQ